MSDFILKQEPFSLKILERVPVPQTGECFLLYKEGAGKDESIVINSGGKYSSAEIRHGHYNQKVTISLKEQNVMVQNLRIAMKDEPFCFRVNVHIGCVLQDIKEYFFSERLDEQDIRRILRTVINENSGVWEMREGLKAQNAIEESVERKFGRYSYIRFKIRELMVVPDESAAKIIESEANAVVTKQTKRKKTEAEIVCVEEDYKLQQAKMKGMAANMKHFGIFGPVVSEYIDGKLTGTELYDRMMKARIDEIGLLKTTMGEDSLTHEQFSARVEQILSGTNYIQSDDKPQLAKKNDTMIEEHYSEEDSLEDGDRI